MSPIKGIVFDGSGNTGRDIMKALERRYPFGLIPYYGSKPGGRFYVNARTACAAALARRLDPETDRGVKRKPFHIPNGPHVQALFKELGELRYRLKAEKSELETKQDLMLRLGRSPDFADARSGQNRGSAIGSTPSSPMRTPRACRGTASGRWA